MRGASPAKAPKLVAKKRTSRRKRGVEPEAAPLPAQLAKQLEIGMAQPGKASRL